MKGFQPGTNLVKAENGEMRVASHCILNRRGNRLSVTEYASG